MKYIITRLLLGILILLTLQSFSQIEDSTAKLHLISDSLSISYEDATMHPLKPPKTNSPRATLTYFISSMNKFSRISNTAYLQSIQEPGLFFSDEVIRMNEQAEYLFNLSVYCLDMSRFPPALREDVGYTMAIMLKEILDRIDLPPLTEIPDSKDVELDLETKKYPKLLKWAIPNTDIVISRIETGDRAGEFLFSPTTVHNLPEYYQRIKNQPYKTNKLVTKGAYNFYISSPGHILPPKWRIFIPDWSLGIYLGQTIWQWISFMVSILLVTLIVRFLYKLLIQRSKKRSNVVRSWSWVLFFLLLVFIIEIIYYFLNDQINITDNLFIYTTFIYEILSLVLIAIIIYYMVISITATIINSNRIDKIGIEATYTRAIFGIIGFISAAAVLVFGLSQIGVSIIPLITGLGIGGLAIALAARSTIENVIASFTIFADKPYKVNDRVKVMGHNGTIEVIGIRSTQIRMLSGSLVSIPNEKMATVEIDNIQRRLYLRREFDITITYDTTPENIEKSLHIIKEILSVPSNNGDDVHPNHVINEPGYPPRVHFDKFNPDSLNIYVSYWYFPPNWWDFTKFNETVNLNIIKRFNAEAISFAFPTVTIDMPEKV